MPENTGQDALRDNVQTSVIDNCTYKVTAFFGDKVKLEDIIAQRVRKELNAETAEIPENPTKTACLLTD